MKSRPLPSLDRLRALFELDASGALIWKPRPALDFKTARACAVWNARYAGRPAGYPTPPHGYIKVEVDNRPLYAHRIIFALVHGRDPGDDEIDHRNRAPGENAPENLRPANRSQQLQNRAANRSNRTGVKGASLHECGRYSAQIGIGGRKRHLGLFDTAEEAGAAYQRAALEHFGEFACAEGSARS